MAKAGRGQTRRDSKRRVLRPGESVRADRKYQYKYHIDGKPHFVYSWKLEPTDKLPKGKKPCLSLRELEKQVNTDLELLVNIVDGQMTVCELVDRYLKTKTGVRQSTKQGYVTVQRLLAKETFGKKTIRSVKTSDAKLFLIKLQQEDGKSYSSIHTIRGVLRPAFQMAVDDDILVKNPFGFQLAGVLVNDAVTREVKTICTDIIQERGYITYVFECKKPEQMIIHSLEELPESEHGTIQVGNIEIPWRDKLYHFLIVGRTGSGKTELTKQIMYLLKRQNVRVVYCDPKNSIDMHWFCKQYDIRYFSTENDIAKTVREFEESMLHREQDLKNMNLEQAPFNEEFLVFDELLAYGKNASKKNFEEVSRRIGSLVLQGRGKQCYVCLITQRADINDKTILDGATRDNLFVRIQMGNGSETSNKMVFGSEFAHVKNYRTEKGSGLIYREGIDSKPRELLVPYLKTE